MIASNFRPDFRPAAAPGLFFAFLIFVMTAALSSQELVRASEIYLLPQTVYVGDRGRIVVPLGPAFSEARAFVIVTPNDLPEIKDLVISRIELEKRGNNTRLLIDFISYAPGIISLPPIMIPGVNQESSGNGALILDGIEITVASILTPESMVLSSPTLPLAAPGTGLLVYGGLGALLVLLIGGIAALLYFRRFFEPILKRYKQRKILASLENKIMFLRSDNSEDDPITRNEMFSLLAGEFRDFLTFFSGVNCGPLTPLEFGAVQLEVPGIRSPDYFSTLFRRWDALRFSGAPIPRNDMFGILDDILLFFSDISEINNAEKNP